MPLISDSGVFEAIVTTQNRRQGHNVPRLTFRYKRETGERLEYIQQRSGRSEELLSIARFAEPMVSGLERTGISTWTYLPTGESLFSEDVLERFPDVFPQRIFEGDREPDWLKEVTGLIDVRLIEAQRLLRLPKTRRARGGGEIAELAVGFTALAVGVRGGNE